MKQSLLFCILAFVALAASQGTRGVRYSRISEVPYFSAAGWHELNGTTILSYSGNLQAVDSQGNQIRIGLQSPGEPNFGIVPAEGALGGWNPGDVISGHPDPTNNQFFSLIPWNNTAKRFDPQILRFCYISFVASGAWGAFYFDTVGTFGYQLLYRSPTNRWIIVTPTCNYTDITNRMPADTIAEAMTVLTENPAKWGPYAGWLLVGDEASRYYVINPNNFTSIRLFTRNSLPSQYNAEHLVTLKKGWGYFSANVDTGVSTFIPADDLAGLEESVLCSNEFTKTWMMAITNWNDAIQDFNYLILTASDGVSPKFWEQGNIIPVGIRNVPPANFTLCMYAAITDDSGITTRSRYNSYFIPGTETAAVNAYNYDPTNGISRATNPVSPQTNSIAVYFSTNSLTQGSLTVIIGSTSGTTSGSLTLTVTVKNIEFSLSRFTLPAVMDDSAFNQAVSSRGDFPDSFSVPDANGVASYRFRWGPGKTDGFVINGINIQDLNKAFSISLSVSASQNLTQWVLFQNNSNPITIPLSSTITLARMSCSCGDNITQSPFEQCDGGSCCNEICQFRTGQEICVKNPLVPCDVDKFCSGSSAACPPPPPDCQLFLECQNLRNCSSCNTNPNCAWCCGGTGDSNGLCFPANKTDTCPSGLSRSCGCPQGCVAGTCACGICTCDDPVNRGGIDCSQYRDCLGRLFNSPNDPGFARIDQCGVCNGDGTSCLGCDGVPNSGLKNDTCGVCNGTNDCLILRCPETTDCGTCTSAGCTLCPNVGCYRSWDVQAINCEGGSLRECPQNSITPTLILAASISAGIVAAIVIAIVVALVLAGVGGKLGYDYYNKRKGAMGNVQSNPLYENGGNSGENPFYQRNEDN